MTPTELIAEVRTELTGNSAVDIRHIREKTRALKGEPNAAELLSALAELAFSLMPEEQQEYMKKVTFIGEQRMDRAFHEAMGWIQEGKRKEAETRLAEISDKIHEYFEQGGKKYFSFRNPFEYHLYRMYYPTDTEFERAPFDFAQYLTMYGYVLLENHQVRKAAQTIERGIRFNPVNADIRFELAEVYKFARQPKRLLQTCQETLRICTSPDRIARVLANLGFYCVVVEDFYSAAVFYFESLRFQASKAVNFELQDVLHRMKTIGQTFAPPTKGQVLDTFETYGMEPPPNSDLVNLAITLAERAHDYNRPDLEGMFYRVAYDLTNEPKFKELLDRIDAETGKKSS